MCLSVYIGSNIEIPIPNSFPKGSLGIELAAWTPPPLKSCKHIYYLGRQGEQTELECSCLLLEHITWTADGPMFERDDTYPTEGPCPFETLRNYCEIGLRDNSYVMLVSDDSGGLEQFCDEDDYESMVTKLTLIKKGNFLFCDPSNTYPCRAYLVVGG